jgi:hypothetical protein
VIVTYAGRRAQSLGNDPRLVGKRIRRLLAALQPSTVVGAAADGGDLLILEAALALPNGPAAHVVLPTARNVFLEDSVEEDWRDRFDAALEEVERRNGQIETLDLEPGEAAYRRANQVILDRAAALAGSEHRSVALVVAREGEGQMIQDLIQSLYRPEGPSREALDEAERVLKRVLVKRQGHPEVWALLGAVAKRRIWQLQGHDSRRTYLQLALDCYRHDFERNLNLYYEGINVVAMGVALALVYDDLNARTLAQELLPGVRLAARLASAKPDERYWAEATIAECALHENLLAGSPDPGPVGAAYRKAGAERPSEGDLDSTLMQLEFLERLGLPKRLLVESRSGLLQGAGRDEAGR